MFSYQPTPNPLTIGETWTIKYEQLMVITLNIFIARNIIFHQMITMLLTVLITVPFRFRWRSNVLSSSHGTPKLSGDQDVCIRLQPYDAFQYFDEYNAEQKDWEEMECVAQSIKTLMNSNIQTLYIDRDIDHPNSRSNLGFSLRSRLASPYC